MLFGGLLGRMREGIKNKVVFKFVLFLGLFLGYGICRSRYFVK